jgi:hypothetical protein
MKKINLKKTSAALTLSLVVLAASLLFNGCKKDEKPSITSKTNASLKSSIGASTLAKHDTIGPITVKVVGSSLITTTPTTKKDTIGPVKK